MPIFTTFCIIFATLASSSAVPSESEPKLLPLLESLITDTENMTIDINTTINTEYDNVCTTKSCHKIAKLHALSMDKNVDPCNDFYKYTCGGWVDQHRVETKTPGNEMDDKQHLILRKLMKLRNKEMLSSAPDATDIRPVRLAKLFYQSCMNTDARKARGIKTIASILQSNGGWPMAMNVQDWNSDAHPWQEVDGNFTDMGGDYTFYELKPTVLKKNNTSQPGIILDAVNNWPAFNENFIAHQRRIQPIIEAFIHENGANVSTEQLQADIHGLFIFERKLQAAWDKWKNSRVNTWNLPAFVHDWSQIVQYTVDWQKVIHRFFDIKGIEVTNDWAVIIKWGYYVALVQAWTTTDERTIVNYIHWKFVNQMLPYTTNEMLNGLRGYRVYISDQDRSDQCLKETGMTHAYAYWFGNNYFGEHTQKDAKKLARNVKQELIKEMNNSNWLSDNVKAKLKDELLKLRIVIGLSHWQRNRTAIENHYERLLIGDDYVTNILSFRKYQSGISTSRQQWFIRNTPNTVDSSATYFHKNNMIKMGAGYLLPPYFDSELPNYLNYAKLGMVIGHELGHGLYQARRKVDRESSIREPDMVNKTGDQFSCIEEYSTKFVPKKRASLTISEDAADIIGIQSSFGAYKRLRQNEKFKGDLKLPGFEQFTDDQMFFLSFGQMWCGLTSSEDIDNWDIHSPVEFRINFGVSNTPEFGNAFNCPLGTSMNPATKCSDWTKVTYVPYL